MYHGLSPSKVHRATNFYSGFQVTPAPEYPFDADLDMGEDVHAFVRLFEPLPRDVAMFEGHPERDYADTPYPEVEYRILAGYKIWGAIRYFFAYRDLGDQDWDEVFAQYLPKLIAAKDALEYNRAVAEMLTHTSDSQTIVHSPELDRYFGEATPGLTLRLIEKKPVVVGVSEEAEAAGVRIGDVVRMIDGENIVDRFHREERLTPASTTQSIGYLLMQRILNGPPDSIAQITVEGAGERIRNIRLKRTAAESAPEPDEAEPFKLINARIGYADLCRLKPAEVDGMFERFRRTRGIIFDMRCGDQQTAYDIAPRLTDKRDTPAAIVTGPMALWPDIPDQSTGTSVSSYFSVRTVSASKKPKYAGKTVMLIDERTQGPAEFAGLLFEAANNTQFIGTPSAGASGETTNFVVPGGVAIEFSGTEVRHPNGGALQRLGLQPAGTVAPTIAGIRARRDEVLDKAVAYLSQ
jgi:C-terminal processing protease CtpA/Prc